MSTPDKQSLASLDDAFQSIQQLSEHQREAIADLVHAGLPTEADLQHLVTEFGLSDNVPSALEVVTRVIIAWESFRSRQRAARLELIPMEPEQRVATDLPSVLARYGLREYDLTRDIDAEFLAAVALPEDCSVLKIIQ